VEFAEFIDKKYGGSALIQLKLASRTVKKFNGLEIAAIAAHYKEKAQKLAIEKGIELW